MAEKLYHGRLTEGEGRVNTGSCVQHTDRLRNDALRSRQRRSSPTPEPLEVENAQLRDELQDVREEQIQLRHDVERLQLEHDHLAERLEFAKDKGSRPYPRPSYSKKEMTLDTSSESSIGANRSKERAWP